MSCDLSDVECVVLAANVNADTVRDQQRELRALESKLGYARHLIAQLLEPHDLMCRIRARKFLEARPPGAESPQTTLPAR